LTCSGTRKSWLTRLVELKNRKINSTALEPHQGYVCRVYIVHITLYDITRYVITMSDRILLELKSEDRWQPYFITAAGRKHLAA